MNRYQVVYDKKTHKYNLYDMRLRAAVGSGRRRGRLVGTYKSQRAALLAKVKADKKKYRRPASGRTRKPIPTKEALLWTKSYASYLKTFRKKFKHLKQEEMSYSHWRRWVRFLKAKGYVRTTSRDATWNPETADRFKLLRKRHRRHKAYLAATQYQGNQGAAWDQSKRRKRRKGR